MNVKLIRISFLDETIPQKSVHFFYDQRRKEEEFVLPHSNFIHSHSYIFPLSQNLAMVQYDLNPEVNLINCITHNSGRNQEIKTGITDSVMHLTYQMTIFIIMLCEILTNLCYYFNTF